jgi:hypothetical protein
MGVDYGGRRPTVFQHIQDVSGGDALGVHLQGSVGEIPRQRLIAAGKCHPSQASQCDRVRGVQVNKLPVRTLGLGQSAVGERLVGPKE